MIEMPSSTPIKADNNFSPCPVEDGEEIYQNGIFEFNIARMIDFVHANPPVFRKENVSVDDFPQGFSRINADHMASVHLGEPVILAEIAPGRYNLIDGNHRMKKARRLWIKRIEACRINVEHNIQFITSMEAYSA
jgi:hypothetical protein